MEFVDGFVDLLTALGPKPLPQKPDKRFSEEVFPLLAAVVVEYLEKLIPYSLAEWFELSLALWINLTLDDNPVRVDKQKEAHKRASVLYKVLREAKSRPKQAGLVVHGMRSDLPVAALIERVSPQKLSEFS